MRQVGAGAADASLGGREGIETLSLPPFCTLSSLASSSHSALCARQTPTLRLFRPSSCPRPLCSCDPDDKCCSQYEHCVSCCLSPQNTPEQRLQGVFRGRNK